MVAGRWPAVALSVVAAVLALLAWWSGLDRMSATAPALAARIPAPLRGQAWRSQATAALTGQRPDQAQLAARRAVAADPLDPASSSLLASARFASGDGPGAAAAYRVAGTRGWRDGPTQLYWYAAALQAGEFEVAAQRADALLRQGLMFDRLDAVLAPLEATPAGRAALARRLAVRPPWLVGYLGAADATPAGQLAERAAVLAEPAVRSARLGCAELPRLIAALILRGRAAAGRALRARYCGGQGGLLADGGFERAQLVDPDPFAWQFPGAAGLDLQLQTASRGGGRTLVVRSNLPGAQPFAEQRLALAPGRYRLGWRARDDTGQPSPRVRATLSCERGGRAYLPALPAGADRFAAEAVVSDACREQWLELTIAPGGAAVTVDDVALTRLSPASAAAGGA